MRKRKIFGEVMDGIAAMKSHREGKITLRTYKVEAAPLPKVDSKLIRDTRKRLRCSRAVFARKLRINERTLEKWEQGLAKPNPQAAVLVLLVRKYPDTLERLQQISSRSLLRRNEVCPIPSRYSWREEWRERIKCLCILLDTLTHSIPVGAIRTGVLFPFRVYPLCFPIHP